MNYQNLIKYFSERNFLIVSFLATLIFLLLNIVGIMVLPPFLRSIIFAVFQYKIWFLILSFTFIILSFLNIVQDTNGTIKISLSSSILKILFKLFGIIFLIIYTCIPTQMYDFKIYMIQNAVLITTLIFMAFLIYFAKNQKAN